MDGNHLGSALRTWRNRTDPAELGLSRARNRRAAGLRREEVAAQAGISVNYLTRLEQGHASTPSASVVASLARALCLDRDEAAHLHHLAGHADSASRVASRHLTPSVQRIICRLDDMPVVVLDPAWSIVAANAPAASLLGRDPTSMNVALAHFIGSEWIKHDEASAAHFEREVANDLYLQRGRHPDDTAVQSTIRELEAGSARFRELWADATAQLHHAASKTLIHPQAGPITVDCDVLDVAGSDLRVVAWSAQPGTPDASALALAGVVGCQQFSAPVDGGGEDAVVAR